MMTEIRKRYWMNQGMQLKQHLKTTTRAFKCINQIRKWLSFGFLKICWHFFMKIWKCKILMKIRKSGKYIRWIKVCNWNTSYRQQKELSNTRIKSKMHSILIFKNMLTFFHEHLSICSTSSRAVTRLTVYRASHIPDLAPVELAHTQNILN